METIEDKLTKARTEEGTFQLNNSKSKRSSKNVDKLNRWFKERKDSLLLKKYVFTLSDLEKDERSVTITYP